MSAPASRRRGGPGERPGSSWAVIAGGGTAGHVLPGISIAQQIVAGGAPRESRPAW